MTISKLLSGGRGAGKNVEGPTKWFIALTPTSGVGTPGWTLSAVSNVGMICTQDTNNSTQTLALINFNGQPIQTLLVGAGGSPLDNIVVGAHPTLGIAVSTTGGVYEDYVTSYRVNLHLVSPSGSLLWSRYGVGRNYESMAPVELAVTSTAVYCGWNRIGAGTVSRNVSANTDYSFSNIGGALQWEFTFPLTPASYAPALMGLAADGNENVYVLGRNPDPNMFNGRSLLLYKLNSSGTTQFNKHFYSTTTVTGNSSVGVKVNRGGAIATGYISTTPFTVLSFDTSGNLQWARTLTTATISGVEIDSFGNVFALGSDTTTGIYLAKWNPSGTLLWQKKIAPATTTSASSGKLFLDFKGRLCFQATINAVSYLVRLPDAPPNGTYTVDGVALTISSSALTSASTSPTVANSTLSPSGFGGSDDSPASPYSDGAGGASITFNPASIPSISGVYRGRSLT